MTRLLFSVLGVIVLSLGWGVDVSDLGMFRFVAVWVAGSMILTDLTPYMIKKYSV